MRAPCHPPISTCAVVVVCLSTIASFAADDSLQFNDATPHRYELSARASQIDPRTRPHPEIDFVFEKNGKPADVEKASVDTRVKPKGKLVIWLMGYSGPLFERVNSYGLHAMQVHYANGWFNKFGNAAPAGDDKFLGKIRLEAATGEDFSDVVNIPKPDGMMERALQFVKWLAKENPQGRWDYFLSDDRKHLRWDRVIIAGSSHGSTTAARFAKYQRVDRVVMFCGPRDQLETWQGLPSATPANRFFAFSHVLDGGWTGHHYDRSWELLGLNQFGPIVNVDHAAAPYGNTRRLITDADVNHDAGRAHSSVVPGRAAPKDASGHFLHEDVWRYLFTHPVEQTGQAVPREYLRTMNLRTENTHAAKPPSPAEVAFAEHGMVVSNHPLATAAGVNVLKSGGNAIDAAVAVALTLGVVDGSNSGIGGGCFFLAHLADGSLVALDGRETAPARATATMFVRDGKGDTSLSQVGALASGVPGSLALYDHVVSKYGKKQLSSLILPAAEIAEQGFVIDSRTAVKIRDNVQSIARFPSTAAVLLKANGKPLSAGDVLKQRDLGRSYREIAAHGVEWFYKGPFAQATDAWMKANGGILTAADFANYQIKSRTPLQTKYRGYTVVGFPPPSSGGIHVAQILTMLDQFDLKALEKKDRASRIHVTAEAMKLAFADRAYWLGDPDFVHVPEGLIDPAYCIERAKLIDENHASHDFKHGDPPNASSDYFSKHTTHIAVADQAGNWVAITATVNTSFGSKVIVPGTGVLLNNQMDDFSVQSGVPNHFRLIGSEANAPAAGKRPLSCMSPTIIMQGDQPLMTLGAAGGPTIITQVALVASNVLALDDDLGTAMSRVRFHHQWSPDSLLIENTAPRDVLEKLTSYGHVIDSKPPAGATQAILRLPDGRFAGASDPRGRGTAAGW